MKGIKGIKGIKMDEKQLRNVADEWLLLELLSISAKRTGIEYIQLLKKEIRRRMKENNTRDAKIAIDALKTIDSSRSRGTSVLENNPNIAHVALETIKRNNEKRR